MSIHPIRTKEDHRNALKEIEMLWGAKVGTPNGDRLDVLCVLVEHYEEKNYPIEAPDPVETIRIFMEEHGFTQSDFGSVIGSQSRASEVLRKSRRLNLSMIQKVRVQWKIPADVLVAPYHLEVDNR
ncbi:helix-turn-helix domain-containing protein [Cognatishimia maritima]|uniref:Transcriptional regulator, XRE family n=1 Tax=Cognatishimia maritima TaxID=870908 RepID=A0A1M5PAN7_9RHOB|nr:transcriptional regulator [Cognatishimia maritima]SHG98303.1 transcriptional regulator, XRE family [Cognatishimia maritima]